MISIAFFNNKGRVGKTTSTYAIGSALAENGKKVLLVDADPQCNLSGYFFGIDKSKEYENFLQDKNYHNVYSLTAHHFNPGRSENTNATFFSKHDIDLLLGHIRIAEYESDLNLAFQTNNPALQHLPLFFYKSILEPYHDDYDYILIDMNPSYGVINLCLLMVCNYFIMPIFPDYFCYQVISNMSTILKKWNENIDHFRQTNLDKSKNKLPQNIRPKFLGTITQNFRIYNGKLSKGFEGWQQKINLKIKESMIHPLIDIRMSIDEKEFKNVFDDQNYSQAYNIQSIPDYNTLATIAQQEGMPVNLLSEEILKNHNRKGGFFNQDLKSINKIKTLFDYIAKSLIKLNE